MRDFPCKKMQVRQTLVYATLRHPDSTRSQVVQKVPYVECFSNQRVGSNSSDCLISSMLNRLQTPTLICRIAIPEYPPSVAKPHEPKVVSSQSIFRDEALSGSCRRCYACIGWTFFGEIVLRDQSKRHKTSWAYSESRICISLRDPKPTFLHHLVFGSTMAHCTHEMNNNIIYCR